MVLPYDINGGLRRYAANPPYGLKLMTLTRQLRRTG